MSNEFEPAQPPRAKRDAYDWATLAVAVIGVIVVAWSAVVSAWNTELVREQVSVMRNQDRPWITSELVPEHFGVDIQDGVIEVFAEERLKNVGELVATNVVSRHRLMLSDQPQQRSRIKEIQDTLCAQADASLEGTAVFPDQTATNHWVIRGSTDSEFPGSEFKLFVVGCVAYNFFDIDDVHVTPFAYQLTRKVTSVQRRPGVTITTETSGQPFRAENGRTLPNRLAIERYTLGNNGVN